MLSFYILILGFISGVCMETCPKPEDIYPCKCSIKNYNKDIITVECGIGYGLKTKLPLKLLQQALNGLVGKNDVELNLYSIQDTLPSNVFSGIGIKILYFKSCRLESLTKDDQPGLLGLENHLEILGFYNSSLIPAKLHLGHLKKLGYIALSGSNILELGDDWLSNVPPSLEYLFILGNNITKIESNAFSRLNNLVVFLLEDNRLCPIKRSMFPTTYRIKSLSLKNNAMTDLPVDLFNRMPSITSVNLARNGITTLDERTWSPIWKQLVYLDLSENNIVCDDRLNWIIKSKKRPSIYGECSAPKEFKGKDLEDFFESRSR